MTHKRSALVGLGLVLCTSASQAALVVDQEFVSGCCVLSALADSASFSGQSFTAGTTGSLVRVDLEAARSSDFTMPWILDVQKLSGGVATGNIVSSTTIAHTDFPTVIPPTGDPLALKIQLASPVAIEAGEQFAITLHPEGVEGDSPKLLAGYWAGDVNAGYLGGTALQGPFADALVAKDYDLHFRTVINAVPEPATFWTFGCGLLALLGFQRIRRSKRGTVEPRK